MSSPKRRIGNTDSFYLNILAVKQINDTGTLLIHIRTVRIPLPTQPKRFPITETIAIEHTFSRDSKTVNAVCINQSCIILYRLSFHAGKLNSEITRIITSFQYGIFFKIQMRLRFKEKRTA